MVVARRTDAHVLQRPQRPGVPGYRLHDACRAADTVHGSLSPRVRVVAVVALTAALAAGLVVGITAASSDRPAAVAATTGATAKEGPPPFSLDLGVRTDAEATDLRRALALYEKGDLAGAGTIFAKHSSLEARVGQAFVRWPDATVARLTQLAGLHPKSALVQLNLGIALYWAGDDGAKDAWRAAAALEPDTAYAVTAGNLLHPSFARNLPVFVPSFDAPADISSLSAPEQLQELERRAASGERDGTLLYGVALQRLGRQRSAERVFAALAARRPDDAEAQVAAAVARFDKAAPARAFSRLGPLSRRFPGAATVRFHLGLLLLWSGQVEQARRQLRLAGSVEPGSALAREAKRYLDELAAAGV